MEEQTTNTQQSLAKFKTDLSAIKCLERYGIDVELITQNVTEFLLANKLVYSEFHDELISKKDLADNIQPSYGAIHTDYDEDFVYVWNEGSSRFFRDDCSFSDHAGEWFLEEDVFRIWNDLEVTQEFIDSHSRGYYFLCEQHDSLASGEWMYYDDCYYCEDIETRVPINETTFHEISDCYYFYEENVPEDPTNSRSHINEYHSGPSSEDKTEGSEFAIGFEVEKNNIFGLGRDDVGEEIGLYDMFARFETDSSCGLEAITHIFPLSPVRSVKRKKFFDMIDSAKDVLDSPTNNKCGGHITISVGKNGGSAIHNPMRPIDLLEKVRGNLAIVYALYRFRLNNSYCSGSKDLKNIPDESGHKVVELKNRYNSLEIRLFNKVINSEQLKLRYDLMYLIVRASLDGMQYADLLKEIKPILLKMYNNNKVKVKEIMELSVYFRTYLIADIIHPDIEHFIEGPDED